MEKITIIVSDSQYRNISILGRKLWKTHSAIVEYLLDLNIEFYSRFILTLNKPHKIPCCDESDISHDKKTWEYFCLSCSAVHWITNI